MARCRALLVPCAQGRVAVATNTDNPLTGRRGAGPIAALLASLAVLLHVTAAFSQPAPVSNTEVPFDADMDLILGTVYPADREQDRGRFVRDHLVGTEIAFEAIVEAEIDGVWRPVAYAPVTVTLSDPEGSRAFGATTRSDGLGRAVATIPAGTMVGQVQLSLEVGGRGASDTMPLRLYDYVVEIESTDPADATARSYGQDGLTVNARLRRHEVDPWGEDLVFSNPGPQRAAEMAAVTFSGGPRLVLTGQGDLHPDDETYRVVPPDDGRMSFTVTSTDPDDFVINAYGTGNRFRTRGDPLGSVPVSFTESRADIELSFGPLMQQYVTGPRTIRIPVDINDDRWTELEIQARDRNGRPAEVPVRVRPTDGSEVHVVYSETSTLIRDGRTNPNPRFRHPGPGPQTLIVSGGAEELTVVVVGTGHEGPDFSLQAVAEPAQVNLDEATEATVTGSIVFPEGTDFAYRTGTHELRVEVDRPADLTATREWRHRAGSVGDTYEFAILRPDPDTGRFSFTVAQDRAGDVQARIYVRDRASGQTRLGFTVEQIEVPISFVDEPVEVVEPVEPGCVMPTDDAGDTVRLVGEARGSPAPPVLRYDVFESVRNGDFNILGHAGSLTVGDGSEERTLWGFDFRESWSDAPGEMPTRVDAACLTLTLTTDGIYETTGDLVHIFTLGDAQPPAITDQPSQGSHDVTIKLLDYYSSDRILEALDRGNGQMLMAYAENAVVSFARLELALTRVPDEPEAAVETGCVMPMNDAGDTARLVAQARGSATPPVVDFDASDTVTNGDFTIVGTPGNDTVGDSINESTYWSFDFGESWSETPGETPTRVDAACLTVTLTTNGDPLITTDSIQIEGLPAMQPPAITDQPSQDSHDVTINLLDHYSSDQILQALDGGQNGGLSMKYEDDAIVSFARLELILTRVSDEIEAPVYTNPFGEWATDWGSISLAAGAGGGVQGTYFDGGMSGSLDGQRLEGRWWQGYETGLIVGCETEQHEDHGSYALTFNEAFTTFTGTWTGCRATDPHFEWSGQRR